MRVIRSWQRRASIHFMASRVVLALVAVLSPTYVIVQKQGYLNNALLIFLVLIALSLWAWYNDNKFRKNLAVWLNDKAPQLQDSAELLPWFSETRNEPAATIVDAGSVAQLQQRRISSFLSRIQPSAILPRISWPIWCLLSVLMWGGAITLRAPNLNQINVDQSAIIQESVRWPVDVVVTVTPPAYTGVAPFLSSDKEIQAPQYADIQLCVQADITRYRWRWLDENEWKMPACETFQLTHHRAYIIEYDAEVNQDEHNHVPLWQGRTELSGFIHQVDDTGLQLAITKPSQEWSETSPQNRQVEITFKAKDDYGIREIDIHWTLARGSGENVRFRDKREPLFNAASVRENPSTKNNGLSTINAQGLKQSANEASIIKSFAELGFEPGDELYFYLSGYDNNPFRKAPVKSRVYAIKLPSQEVLAHAEASLPPLSRETGLRSQRQIILDTENLIAQRAQITEQIFQQRAQRLANDQHVLRLRYGEFLGEESSFSEPYIVRPENAQANAHGGDEADHSIESTLEHEAHAGHEHANLNEAKEAQTAQDFAAMFGHSHDTVENATLYDDATKKTLRTIIQAMWNAERELRLFQAKAALIPEYEALKYIKILQQAERVYLHKTNYVPTPISEEDRFKGETDGMASRQRRHDALFSEEERQIALWQRWLSESPSITRIITDEYNDEEMRAKALEHWLRQRSAKDVLALRLLGFFPEQIHQCDACRQQVRDYLQFALPITLVRPKPTTERHAQLLEALRP